MSDTPEAREDVGLELWLLIQDQPEAQQLFVTWPQAHRMWQSDEKDALYGVWEELSGVAVERIQFFEPMLFGNRLLTWDGGQSNQVLGMVRAQIAAELNRLRKRLPR